MRMTSLLSTRIVRYVIVSMIVAGLLGGGSPFVRPTLSCPGPPPRPLRELYMRSASVVIAHVGKSEVVPQEENDGEDSDNGATQLKTSLLVSSTLKGEHQPVVYVRHYSYGDYKDKLSSASPDDTLLVFLTRLRDMDGYYVDMNYGIKALTEADLKVYQSRIDELASLLKSGNPTDSQIVEWLVRCAEEPATRWEGAYELAMSHYMHDRNKNDEPDADTIEVSESQTAAPGPEISESADDNPDPGDRFGYLAYPKPEFAKIMTAEQKYRLGTALVNSPRLESTDLYLLELVKRSDDARLVPFLLAQLELIAKPDQREAVPYFTENLMSIVADKLGDNALKEMVKRFSGNVYPQGETYDDEEEYAGESEEAEDADVDAEQEAAREAAEAAAVAQRMSAELQHFVTLALSTVPKSPENEVSDAAAAPAP